MSSPYAPVTPGRELLPPGWRMTAYWYASQRGLPVSFAFLLELGLRAARAARWYGLEQAPTAEGPLPDGSWLRVHTWPERIWDEAAAGLVVPCAIPAPPPVPPPYAYARPDSPRPMVHDVLALQRRYRHSGDPAWESADGNPEGHGDPPQPDVRLTAWQYAGKARMLTYDDSDAEFVRDLDSAAWYVAGKRGVAAQSSWDADGRPVRTWPESLWRDVSGAMAQRSAERGDWVLAEDELDAVADGYLPEPGYRPGGRPNAVQFMARYDEPPADGGFWSYPAPPEDTQAYQDWTVMADRLAVDDTRYRDWRRGIEPQVQAAEDLRGYSGPYAAYAARLDREYQSGRQQFPPPTQGDLEGWEEDWKQGQEALRAAERGWYS